MKSIGAVLFYGTLIMSSVEAKVIYDFNENNTFRDWVIIDDGVMGGVSSGKLRLDSDGHGLFYGYVSLANYGGFTSVRLRKKVSLRGYEKIVLRISGDDKFYQLRIKSEYGDRHVYSEEFYAKKEWEEVEIQLSTMSPQFRGRSLRKKNFNSNNLVELGILIGNKVEEQFVLKIDYIGLK